MKASSFPRIYRAYDLDEKRMFMPEQLAKAGFKLAPDGLPSCDTRPMFNVVLMWFTGKIDQNGKQLFEGDICKVFIHNDFGSLTIDYGIMRWHDETGFTLMIPSAQGGVILNVQSVELLGNEFENEELVPLVKHDQPSLEKESANG